MTRYEHLARLLAERIEQGLYQSGERLPSVRSLSSEHGVSISTVQQAYNHLEDRGLIQPRPRSGYFVAPRRAQPPLPRLTQPVQRPVEVTHWDAIRELLDARHSPQMVALGGGTPDLTQPTIRPLWREMQRIIQHEETCLSGYDDMAGTLALRQQVARLMLDGGSAVTTDDIVITSGCQEAISVAVRAICQPGDVVAVESPSFHGTMQILRGYGVKVLEIPTDSQSGISLEALEMALEQWPVKAVILVASCNNPQGFIMPSARKQALLSLARRFDIAIIEDDVYGELAFSYPRPETIKSLDHEGRVLLCSSFSKTLAPGLRVGWIVPGRWRDRVLHMKYIGTGSTAVVTQLAVAAFIRNGHYHRHLRRLRQHYQRNYEDFRCRIRSDFPCGVCVSRPQGGFLMWLELPESLDTVCISRELRAQQVQIAPGAIFSASGKYRNCLRLNYASAFNEQTARALRLIGNVIAHHLAEQAGT
jgi:DNA-binding transcriptional MocR family regulator